MSESGIYYGEDFKDIFSEEIVNLMDPSKLYPCWEKQEIKRKYGKYPAIYLDVWQPYEKYIFELLPKTPWSKAEWRNK